MFSHLSELPISKVEQNAGKPPSLEWLPLSQLGVDDEYQRPINSRGIKTIERIAAEFRWSRFSPVIVTPVGADKFAVIDGQHRATAALSQGFERVPCYIVSVNPQEAASVFAAVNGVVTPMSAQAVFKAARAGGEKWAVEIDKACSKAGVRPLTFPLRKSRMKTGDTLAIGTLRGIHQRHGVKHLTVTLRCLMAFQDSQILGAITSSTLNRCSKYFTNRPDWVAQIDEVVAACRGLNLLTETDEHIEKLIKRRVGDGRSSPQGRSEITERIRDLHNRRFSAGMIASTLRIPYAEIERTLREIAQ